MRIHSISFNQVITFSAVTIMFICYLLARITIAKVNSLDIRNIFSEGIYCVEAVNKTEEMTAEAIEIVKTLVTKKCGTFADVNSKSIKLYMKDIYVNKDNCKDLAKQLLEEGLIEDMSEDGLAAEIYTHAFFYFLFDSMPDSIHELPVLSKVYNSVSNGIDLENGGDTHLRQIAYAVIYRAF